MKKWFALLLAAVLLLSLCSCGAEPQPTEPENGLKVGYGRACFTPKVPYPLSYTAKEVYDSVHDDVYATAVAITDAKENTLLLVTIDLQHASDQLFKQLVRGAAKAAGIPEENVMVSTTHDHSSLDPAMASSLIMDAVKQSAADAMADRAPAQMFAGSTQTTKLNFVRHYEMNDGSWVGDAYGFTSGKTYVGHEREADSTMQLLKFQREGKKDVLIVNWQAHGNYANLMEQLTADFVGACRTEVEKALDCHFAYYQGAAGNLNPWSRLEDQNLTQDQTEKSMEGMVEYGKLLADYAIKAAPNLAPMTAGELKIQTETFTAQVEEVTTELLDAVAIFREETAKGASRASAAIATGGLINSDSACSAVEMRITLGKSKNMEIKAVSLGSLAFVAAPYEMFDSNGMYIKTNSPYEMTWIVGYCNGRNGYIPSQECIDHGCYEGENRYFVESTAQDLANRYVEMLKTLHG